MKLRLVVLPALVLIFLIAWLDGSPGRVVVRSATADQETRTVQISVDDSTGEVRATPDPISIRPGDTVEWMSELPNWTVQIPSVEAPFGATVRQSGINGRRGQRRGAKARRNAKAGRYKYNIAVFDGQRVRIADPEIIIKPGG